MLARSFWLLQAMDCCCALTAAQFLLAAMASCYGVITRVTRVARSARFEIRDSRLDHFWVLGHKSLKVPEGWSRCF